MPSRGIVAGHGIDLVEIADFARLFLDPTGRFIDRYFRESELTTVGSGSTRIEKLAGRFAVKEAVLKALGAGWGDGVGFTDVEVLTTSAGALSVVLHRELAALAEQHSITGWVVSTSHAGAFAIASVIALASV